MMGKAPNVRIIFCMGILFLTVASHARSADWIFYGENQSTGTMYYDQSNITEIQRDIARVWTKIIYNENGEKRACSFLESIKAGDCDRRPVSHELTLIEMDCAGKKIRAVSTTFYTEEGDPVFSTMRTPRDEWEDIAPDSVADHLKKRVCPR